jgi:hypothetical protein
LVVEDVTGDEDKVDALVLHDLGHLGKDGPVLLVAAAACA